MQKVKSIINKKNYFKMNAVELKNRGMIQSIENADRNNKKWSEIAYKYLLHYLINKKEPFLTEDVRMSSKNVVPEPPSNRAWGTIIVKASKIGIIKKIGYGTTKSKKSHSTPASLWQRSY